MRNIFVFFLLLHSLFFSKSVANTCIEKNVPDTVKIGTYLLSLHDINFRNSEYTVRYWLWMLYNNPDFDFTSQVEVPNAKSIEKPEILVDTIEGKTWVLMKMKSTMKQSWKVTNYPFDKQHLIIGIENTMYDNEHLVFLPDTKGSKYDSELNVDGWKIKNFAVSAGEKEYNTNFGDFSLTKHQSTYASFNISMTLERDAWGLFFKLFIGMYVAFAITLISYNLSPSEVEPRFGLPVGGLFATVGNKYIIDTILPETSAFTLVDTLHAITFFVIFFTIAINTFTLRMYNQDKIEAAKKINERGFYIVICGYIILNILFIGIAIIG